MAQLPVAYRPLHVLVKRCLSRSTPLLTVVKSSYLSHKNYTILSAVRHIPQPLELCDRRSGRFANVRFYAKKAKKEKKDKARKHGGQVRVELSNDELNQIINYNKMRHQMEMAVEHLKQEYIEQLTLRTSTGLFDHLMVETADGKFPLIQIGQIAQKNPQLIVINMATMPQYIPEVKTAIMNSGMNLNPQQDGTSLFIPVPKVTREHREGLAKNAKILCDKAKEKFRHIQNTFIHDLKKRRDDFSSDLVHNTQESIYATTQDFAARAEKLMVAKQQELLGGK